HGARHHGTRVWAHQACDLRLRQQRVDGRQLPPRIGHGGRGVVGTRFLVESTGAFLGTISTRWPPLPWVAPFRFRAVATSTKYRAPGVSTVSMRTVTLSCGTGRWLSSWCTREVSTADWPGVAAPPTT